MLGLCVANARVSTQNHSYACFMPSTHKRSQIWILIGLFVLLQPLNGQIVKLLPEIVPYRLVPSGDNFCHMEIEIVQPQSFIHMLEIQKDETIEILKERAAHEMIQPHEQGTVFSIDDKDYIMFRLPFDVTYSEWYGRDTKYGEYR